MTIPKNNLVNRKTTPATYEKAIVLITVHANFDMEYVMPNG